MRGRRLRRRHHPRVPDANCLVMMAKPLRARAAPLCITSSIHGCQRLCAPPRGSHHVSEARIERYLAEFKFRYSNRAGRDVEEAARTQNLLESVAEKRLAYRPPDEGAHA